MRKLLLTVAAAVVSVLLVATAAYAAGSGQAEPLRNEARAGWQTSPPAEDADVVRDRTCEQDRLQDGSCQDCTADCLQERTRSQQGTADEVQGQKVQERDAVKAGPSGSSGARIGAPSADGPSVGSARGRSQGVGPQAAGPSGDPARTQVRSQIRNLVRVEMRLQQLDGTVGKPSQPGLVALMLQLAERLRAWLGVQ